MTIPDPAPWQEQAKCADGTHDPALWFTEGTTVQAQQARTYAKAICAKCPVKRECLNLAMTTETGSSFHRYGIYGGLGPTARAQQAKKGAAA